MIGRVNLRRTDIIKCNFCDTGELRFKDMLYHSTKENKRSSRHYALGCPNYNKKEFNCGLIYVDSKNL